MVRRVLSLFCIPRNVLQDLYEIAYVYGTGEHFWIYSVHPRCCIRHNSLVSDLTSPSLLVIEESDDAPDPVELFDSGKVMMHTTTCCVG